MSGDTEDAAEKPHEPTPEKLKKARQKGDLPRFADLNVAVGYTGFLAVSIIFGPDLLMRLGGFLAAFLDHADRMAPLVFDGSPSAAFAGPTAAIIRALLLWFLGPALLVCLALIATQSLVFAPTRLAPKVSRISPVANARQKFGLSGLVEFAKSTTKLVLFGVCLASYLWMRLPQIATSSLSEPQAAIALLGRLLTEFLALALLVAGVIGAADALWQHHDHRRKNRMSRKEMMDETKEAEGDPFVRQQRRQRGQEIAMTQMMADVPGADVVIVNPTHYAVALRWSRKAKEAPVCVAKGVDEMAGAIRQAAQAAGVPVHSDPPTARALFATVSIGQEIPEDQYRAVAAAIRFAEAMRRRARDRGA